MNECLSHRLGTAAGDDELAASKPCCLNPFPKPFQRVSCVDEISRMINVKLLYRVNPCKFLSLMVVDPYRKYNFYFTKTGVVDNVVSKVPEFVPKRFLFAAEI